MQELNGRVAVITGGASGMGRAFADRFAAAGMRLAIGDIEQGALDRAVAELTGAGADVIGVRCDVADHDSFTAFGDEVAAAFGQVHVVCLNAGVAGSGTIADSSLANWKWVLGVNLWGIVHGLDVFLPGLLANDEGHVVVTASVAGHTSYANIGAYNASKHAAVTIAETLHNELRAGGSAVAVTCLCPGLVSTNILTSERNRPEEFSEVLAEAPADDDLAQHEAMVEWFAANAKPASEVADLVHDAVIDQTFWLFTDDEFADAIGQRHDEIRTRRNPVLERGIIDF